MEADWARALCPQWELTEYNSVEKDVLYLVARSFELPRRTSNRYRGRQREEDLKEWKCED